MQTASNVIYMNFDPNFMRLAMDVVKESRDQFSGVFFLRRTLAEMNYTNTTINVTIKRLRKRGLVK